MESSTDLKPKISVIVPAFLGYDSVAAALDSWEAQTRRADIEIIVLCPVAPGSRLARGQTVLETGSLQLHEARAAGVRKAKADYVILAEDHCLPDIDCVERMLNRMNEKWDAIGPAIRSGNFPGIVVEGSFLISYAQWLLPKSGSTSSLPGHNAVVRKQPLLDIGDDLDDELRTPVFLMSRLRSEGRSFCIEETAGMRHFDVPHWGRTTSIFFRVGQGVGAVRRGKSSVIVRALFVLLTPLTAARHFARGLIHYARAGHRAGFSPLSLVSAAVFATVWACGESVGAIKGIVQVLPHLWTSEIKPVSRDQVAHFAARQSLSLRDRHS